MYNKLEREVKTILEACQTCQIPLFVIGAFSIRAYDCLLRTSNDLDLAISHEHWLALQEVLTAQGYSLTHKAVWIRATKTVEEEQIEVHIALDGITDFNSALTFLVTHHQPQFRQPSDLDFALPVLPLESVFISKLIAQRDKDIADLVAILLLQQGNLHPSHFWYEGEESGLSIQLLARLEELIERIERGEAMSIWFERTRAILSDTETQSVLTQLHQLRNAYPANHLQ